MICAACDDCAFVDQPDIVYEIHITCAHSSIFEEVCKRQNWKAIEIDMGEEIPTHQMTSITHKEGIDVFLFAQECANWLEYHGLVVQRIKIETVPWNPKITYTKGGYYESHLAIKLKDDMMPLKQICEANHAHMSRNLLKKSDHKVQMVTIRDYNTSYEFFKDDVESIKQRIIDADYECEKTIIEFTLYDSNLDMDNEWMKRNGIDEARSI